MAETELQAAQAAYQAGNLPEAGRLYQRALRDNPRSPQALYGLGLVCLQAEQFAHAEYVFGELVRLEPNYSDGHCVRGIALVRLDRRGDALACFERAVSLRPDSVEALSNLGATLLELGKHEEALAELDRALAVNPRHSPSWNNRGNVLMAMARREEAVADYLKALEIDPEFSLAAENRDEALFQLRRLNRCPPTSMRKLFDGFSANYDETMRVKLTYRGPEILRQLAERILSAREPAQLRLLDLGCGTGLVGAAFCDLAAGGPIDGVDLSPRMIAAARARGIYRNLILGDVETELAKHGLRYDVVLAADSMIYLGDLSSCFSEVSRCLEAGGLFLFTVEAAEGEGWDLPATNRFRHSAAYLRNEAVRCGMELVTIEDCTIRHEYGVAVAGFAVALRKPA